MRTSFKVPFAGHLAWICKQLPQRNIQRIGYVLGSLDKKFALYLPAQCLAGNAQLVSKFLHRHISFFQYLFYSHWI